MRPSFLLPLAALVALVALVALAACAGAGVPAAGVRPPAETESDDLRMAAPEGSPSGPVWLIRSPDLRSAAITLAMGVPRAGAVAVHVREGSTMLEEAFAAAVAREWFDSAVVILERTDSLGSPSDVARTPAVRGESGVSLQLEVAGVGKGRRFGFVLSDSLGERFVAAELDATGVVIMVTQVAALADFAAGRRDPTRILYALGAPYFEFQVEKPAIAKAGNPPPRYPEDMRAQAISGEVLVQFVVDTTGRADMRTFKVLTATHHEFIWAVRQTLPAYRFLPAETEGRKVPMYVQMPFKFNIDRGAFPVADPFGTSRSSGP
jgi:TonB family protein